MRGVIFPGVFSCKISKTSVLSSKILFLSIFWYANNRTSVSSTVIADQFHRSLMKILFYVKNLTYVNRVLLMEKLTKTRFYCIFTHKVEMWKKLFNIMDSCIPKTHHLHKAINLNIIKLGYRTMPNFSKIVKTWFRVRSRA